MMKRLPLISLWLCIPWILAASKYAPSKIALSYDELSEFRVELMPLLDLIASGEGDYNSVNRGRAGDSPGDWTKEHLGKSLTDMTIKEIRQHQGGKNPDCWYNGKKGDANLFAVGRYQLIPCTLKYSTVAIEDFDVRLKYSPEVQDTLGVFLLLIKRPIVRDYLAGIHNNHKEAGQELAKEFASVPIQYSNGRCKRGQSYYCGDKAGNKAHISISDVDKVLRSVRKDVQQSGELYALITGKEIQQSKRNKRRRGLKRWFRKDSGIKNSPISSLNHTLFDVLKWPGTPVHPHVIIEYLEPTHPEPTSTLELVPEQPPPISSQPNSTTINTTDDKQEPDTVEEIDDPRILPMKE